MTHFKPQGLEGLLKLQAQIETSAASSACLYERLYRSSDAHQVHLDSCPHVVRNRHHNPASLSKFPQTLSLYIFTHMDLSRRSTMHPLSPVSFANCKPCIQHHLSDQVKRSFESSGRPLHKIPNFEYHRKYDSLSLEVELPGVQKEHIEIELRGPELCIAAHRFKSSGMVVQEREERTECHGDDEMNMDEGKKASLVYVLTIPLAKAGEYVPEAGIKAEQNDGILKMFVPLKRMDGVRQIAITQG